VKLDLDTHKDMHSVLALKLGVTRRLREWWRLREFWDERRNDTGLTTIYRFKNISSNSGLKPLLIVLESGPKWFWF
jgi:hypothetical protein